MRQELRCESSVTAEKGIVLLHTFEINHSYLAFDSETQALFAMEEIPWAFLAAFDPETGEEPSPEKLSELLEKYPESRAYSDEIISEINSLKEQGAIFAPPLDIRFEQLYPEKPLIKSMCLHICHDCNLRCRYCFAGQGDYHTGKREMLSAETGKRAVDFLIEASGKRHNLDIDFFGGEPLLNWDVVKELVDYCEKRGRETGKDLRLTITTNALLLDDEKTEYINKHFKNCVLSIDGRPEVHDFMRPAPNGKPSSGPVLRNIKNFVEKRGDKEFYVRGTYTHYNTDFTDDVAFLAEQDFRQISMEPVVAEPSADYALSEEDMPKILDEYEKLARLYLKEKDGRHPFRFFHFMIDLDGGPCAFKRLKGCGVGTEYIAVTPSGDIYPCHQLTGEEAFLMGNVKNPPSELNQKVKEQFEKHLLPKREACMHCWARYFCSGGCLANHYHATGSLDGIYEQGCRLQKKRLEAALWVKYMEKLSAEKEPEAEEKSEPEVKQDPETA